MRLLDAVLLWWPGSEGWRTDLWESSSKHFRPVPMALFDKCRPREGIMVVDCEDETTRRRKYFGRPPCITLELVQGCINGSALAAGVMHSRKSEKLQPYCECHDREEIDKCVTV